MKWYVVRDSQGRPLADFKARNLRYAVAIEMYSTEKGNITLEATTLVNFRRLDAPTYRVTALNKNGETVKGVFNGKDEQLIRIKFPDITIKKPRRWWQIWRKK